MAKKNKRVSRPVSIRLTPEMIKAIENRRQELHCTTTTQVIMIGIQMVLTEPARVIRHIYRNE